MSITNTSNDTTLCVSFHFELRDAFRALFKNAKWNPGTKVWEVSNTAANASKLQKFVEMSKEAADAIALSDSVEATEAELQELQEKLDKLAKIKKAAIERKALFSELNEELEAARAKHAAEHAEVKKLHQDSLEEKKIFTSVVDESLKAHGVLQIVSKLQKIWKGHPSSAARKEFYELCGELEEAYDNIKSSTGLDLVALYEVSELNFNTNRSKTSTGEVYEDIYTTAVIV